MRILVVAVAVLVPVAAAAQRGSIPVVASGGPPSTSVTSAPANTPIPTSNGGGPSSPLVSAQMTLTAVRSMCTVLENDGKLFALCDNSTPTARIKGETYLPQTNAEWEKFITQFAAADYTVTGKKRTVVVLNRGAVIAEAMGGEVVRLKK